MRRVFLVDLVLLHLQGSEQFPSLDVLVVLVSPVAVVVAGKSLSWRKSGWSGNELWGHWVQDIGLFQLHTVQHCP